MADDFYSMMTAFFKADASASNTAFNNVFKYMDSLFFKGDSLTNSAGAFMNQPITETDALKFASGLIGGPAEMLKQEIAGILVQSAFVKDPLMKAIVSAQSKDQVKKALDRFKAKIESRIEMIAKMKAEKSNTTAMLDQFRRQYGPELAASRGTSPEKDSAIDKIAESFVKGEDEGDFAVIA